MNRFIEIIRAIGKKQLAVICPCVVLCAAGITVASVFSHRGMERRVLKFFTADFRRIESEKRYLPVSDSLESSVTGFVGELLLGSMERGREPLFPRNAVLRSCYLRGADLYIDISCAGDFMEDDFNFYKKCMLFEKNIFTNYKKVARIYLYIDGNSVYELNNPVTEDAVDILLRRLTAVK